MICNFTPSQVYYSINHSDGVFMNRLQLCDELKKELDAFRPFSPETLHSLHEYYRVGLTYASNALEGNSLTESETKIVIEEGLTVQGKPLRDVYEAIGHAEAYDYLEKVAVDKTIEIADSLKLHELFYRRIDPDQAGKFRQQKVFISGSHYPLPHPEELPTLMEKLVQWLADNELKLHPVKLAAELHRRFVFIHPFVDGNGRVARLLMNLMLMRHGYFITVIPPILRTEYISLLEKAHHDASEFTDFIIDREIETQRELLRLIGGRTEPESVPITEESGPEMLLQILKTHPGWRVPDLSLALKKSRPTVERYLRLLRTRGKIEFRGAPKNGGYFAKQ